MTKKIGKILMKIYYYLKGQYSFLEKPLRRREIKQD